METAKASTANRLQLDIWSDVACPWCYVGKRRFDAALARFANRDAVDVTWRSFELDPSAPAVIASDISHAARIAAKYRMPVEQAQKMIDSMTETAKADGITMRLDVARSGNTFDAHRVLHFAQRHGVQTQLKERLFRAYFSEGEALGERAVLVRLASEVGLDAEAVRAMLASDAETKEVRSDEATARELGINGVPFFVFAGRYGVSGAQSVDVLLEVLEKAWSELPEPAVLEGATCGPAGCA